MDTKDIQVFSLLAINTLKRANHISSNNDTVVTPTIGTE